MKIEVSNGKASFDVFEFLDGLEAEEKVKLAQSIGCEKDVIRSVVDLLLDDMTHADGYWIAHSADDTLEEQRVRILQKLDAVLFEVAKDCRHDRDNAEKLGRAYAEWAFKLYHAWPDQFLRSMPYGPTLPSDYNSALKQQIEEEIEKRKAGTQKVGHTT